MVDHEESAAGRGRPAGRVRLGVDVGGTFTDLVAVDPDGAVRFAKVPSVPADPSDGVLAALAVAELDGPLVGTFAHGTTVATNALLERAGARTALVTTRGFRDVIEIGRQNRPSLYDLTLDRPPALVPRELRFTVAERCGPHGVLEPLRAAEVDRVVEEVAAVPGLDAVAVCLLFSFAHPDHERTVATALRARLPGVTVVASSEVLPVFREYERFTTAVADAYLTPRLSSYLRALERRCADRGLTVPMIMQSSGGVTELAEAAGHAARCVLSGPAGGVVGAAYVAGLSGVRDLLTFDMGGTSTDVAPVLDGQALTTAESVLAGVPIMLPTVDVHSVSAGGGSIAWVDAGGALRVGPRSAGADPGPACYGRGGTRPTVTDADLCLGYLADGAGLGGEVTLSRTAAEAALRELGAPLGLSAVETAAGVVAVADAEMTRALRVVSVERGLDPRELVLVAFGGAGGTHACALAEELGMTRVLVPLAAGVLSALGLAIGDVRRDHARPLIGRLGEVDLAAAFTDLVASADLAGGHGPVDGHDPAGAGAVVLQRRLDCRYAGQSHELTIDVAEPAGGSGAVAGGASADGGLVDAVRAAFEAEHLRRYGHVAAGREIETVAARLVVTVPGPRPRPVAPSPDPTARRGRRRAWTDGAWHEIDVIPRAALGPGDMVRGPAVVEFAEATCLLRRDWTGVVDDIGTLVLTRPAPGGPTPSGTAPSAV
ncbi:hydantoinase/oxoprolinase family protein [Parafrankia discariae]|uniref:hydantoinase/oxoprolinase family protein n=1 Tax=Parafrankia discariae TaxID=365528 RepID=UPI000368E448|nr:hydantoinase/oxoprolinase family protein [Parafrankia discariae]